FSNQSITPCPLTVYATGGPGLIHESFFDSYQGRVAYTTFFEAAGHHVVKAGIDFQLATENNKTAFTGRHVFYGDPSGTIFLGLNLNNTFTGPDQPAAAAYLKTTTMSPTIGGFIQDSWQIF